MDGDFKSQISNGEVRKTPKRIGWRYGTVMVVAVFGVISWLIFWSEELEPRYQGKPVSFWLDLYFESRKIVNPFTLVGPQAIEVLQERQAAVALRKIGTNAIPYYLKLLDTPSHPMAEHFLRLSWSYQFPKLRAACLKRVWQSWNDPTKAAMGFRLVMEDLGTNAPPAVQSLLPLFNKPKTQPGNTLNLKPFNSTNPVMPFLEEP